MPFLSAIINISPHRVRMEVFQMTKNGKETLEQLEQSINFGADLAKRGLIFSKKMDILCDIMQEFAHKLREYDIKFYRVITAGAIREARNCDVLTTRIKTSSGIDIEMLPPEEEIRFLFMHLRDQLDKQYNFRALNTVTFALGSCALLLMISEKGRLKTYEIVPIGLLRSFDKHGDLKARSHKIIPLLKSLNIQKHFDNRKTYSLIGIGENLIKLININDDLNESNKPVIAELKIRQLSSRLRKTAKLSIPQMSEKYSLGNAEASRLLCTAHIVKSLISAFKFKNFILPAFSIHDAIAADMARNTHKSFEGDLIRIAESIGEKYNYNAGHVENVTVNCLKIFDKLHKKYELNRRSRLLLNLAVKLHEVGRFVDLHQYNKHSYYLIRNISLPGLSDTEKLMIAAIASCSRRRIPRNHPKYTALNKEEKSTVNKLTAILLLGNMIDNLSPENIDSKLSAMRLSKNSLTIKTPRYPELSSEHDSIDRDSKLFCEIFGLKLKFKGVPDNYEV
jgi:exopolyphosphatase/guanosine-5'-triphosphate,3'-diphosphate pyrophosphatase